MRLWIKFRKPAVMDEVQATDETTVRRIRIGKLLSDEPDKPIASGMVLDSSIVLAAIESDLHQESDANRDTADVEDTTDI